MRVLKRAIQRSKTFLHLQLEEEEDLWFLYNLISINDLIKSTTIRKVQRELSGGCGVSAETKKIKLTIKVTSTDFSAAASPAGASATAVNAAAVNAAAVNPGVSAFGSASAAAATLRVSGQIAEETQYARMGAYHTFEINTTEEIKLLKDDWDEVYEDFLLEATDISRKADLIYLLLLDAGICNLLCISNNITRVLFKLNTNIPKNRVSSSTSYNKIINKFYKDIAENLFMLINPKIFDNIKVFLIAGPGFYKNAFYDYFIKQAEQQHRKDILTKNKNNLFILTNAPSAYIHCASDILNNEKLQNIIITTKATKQAQAIDQLYRMLNNSYKNKNKNKIHNLTTGSSSLLGSVDSENYSYYSSYCEKKTFINNPSSSSSSSYEQSSLVTYGLAEVTNAVSLGAVHELLICEDLFRFASAEERKNLIHLIHNAKAKAATILKFSDQHISGKQLKLLGGVAAILRFPVYEEQNQQEE